MAKFKKGTSIIEILITMAVISVLFVALLSLTTTSLKTNTYSRNQNLGNKYTYEAADWLRNKKAELGWTVFLEQMNNRATICLNNITLALNALPSNNCGTGTITGTIFRRYATVTYGTKITVTVHTVWNETGTQERDSQAILELGQW